MHQIRFPLGLCPGPHWGSSRCSPRPVVEWGRGSSFPIPSTPTAPRSRRLLYLTFS